MRLVVFIAILFSSSYNCFAGYVGGELQSRILNAGAIKTVPVIIYFKDSVKQNVIKFKKINNLSLSKKSRKLVRRDLLKSLKKRANNSRKSFKQILRSNNISIDRDLWMINAVAVNVPPQLVNALSVMPQVARIDYDSVITLATTVTAPPGPAQWNHDLIKVSDVWNEGFTGEGVVIASMDTGVEGAHPDLAASWRGGTNSWYDPFLFTTQPYDSAESHGTSVMGVMVGGDASGTQIGVAPGAKWISVKIFKDNLSTTLSAIHDGFQWLLDPDGDPLTDDAPDIVNASWGLVAAGCNTEFQADIDSLKQAGIEVVFAAGNDGPADASILSPADYSEVISVGAVDSSMTVAGTSARGPSSCSTGFFPNLVAPGVSVYSTIRSQGFGLVLNPYTSVSGTSFAAPHVSAVIALLKGAVPTASYTDIRSVLYSTAVDLGVPGTDNVNGYGLIDAHAALLRLRCPAGTTDVDGDGWYDECDNCILVSNKHQTDADGDGYGNACDADLNNDGFVGSFDLGAFQGYFVSGDLLIDFDENGRIGSADIGRFSGLFFKAPGPSAFAP